MQVSNLLEPKFPLSQMLVRGANKFDILATLSVLVFIVTYKRLRTNDHTEFGSGGGVKREKKEMDPSDRLRGDRVTRRRMWSLWGGICRVRSQKS